jgi:hypothetical protein
LAPEKSPEGTLPQLDQLLPEFQLPENFSLNQKIDGGAVHNREMLVHKITGGEWEFYFPKIQSLRHGGVTKAPRGARVVPRGNIGIHARVSANPKSSVQTSPGCASIFAKGLVPDFSLFGGWDQPIEVCGDGKGHVLSEFHLC